MNDWIDDVFTEHSFICPLYPDQFILFRGLARLEPNLVLPQLVILYLASASVITFGSESEVSVFLKHESLGILGEKTHKKTESNLKIFKGNLGGFAGTIKNT